MKRERLVWLTAGLMLVLIILAARLFGLQIRPVAGTDEAGMMRQAVQQRRTVVRLDEGRGRIADREGHALAGIDVRALLVQPEDGDINGEQLREAARLLGVEEEVLRRALEEHGQPFLWSLPGEREPAALDDAQVQALSAAGWDWLKVVHGQRRYMSPPVARHLIGFVRYGDRIGAAGLERTFEPFLRSRGATALAYYHTAKGDPLTGLQARVVDDGNGFYPLEVATTIDFRVQQMTERLFEEMGIDDGAAVVMDVQTGDILAMASAPSFDPYRVNPEEGLWRNRGLMSEIPGSVFKTVVAAAALDAGVARPGEMFVCNGKHHRGNIRCHRPGGHGRISLEEAYAVSCNTVFAELAIRLGAEGLSRAAARFGIGGKGGWREDQLATPIGTFRHFAQLDAEESGRLFGDGERPLDPVVLAQSGIGQHSVRITPLQATSWTAAIARGGGALPAARVVTRVNWHNGRLLTGFPAKTVAHTGISGRSARWLKSAMALAASKGTAAGLAGVAGGAGGKTGTAQTGKEGLVHQWFTGFHPLDNPRYAVTILVRNRPADSPNKATETAKRLFKLLNEAGAQGQTNGKM